MKITKTRNYLYDNLAAENGTKFMLFSIIFLPVLGLAPPVMLTTLFVYVSLYGMDGETTEYIVHFIQLGAFSIMCILGLITAAKDFVRTCKRLLYNTGHKDGHISLMTILKNFNNNCALFDVGSDNGLYEKVYWCHNHCNEGFILFQNTSSNVMRNCLYGAPYSMGVIFESDDDLARFRLANI